MQMKSFLVMFYSIALKLVVNYWIHAEIFRVFIYIGALQHLATARSFYSTKVFKGLHTEKKLIPTC